MREIPVNEIPQNANRKLIPSDNMSTKQPSKNGSQQTISMRESNDLPPVDQWPKRPFFFCVNTDAVGDTFNVPGYGDGMLPVGKPFDFESDLFKGQCLLRVAGVECDGDQELTDTFFANRRRKWQIVCQGKFKEELAVADVLYGTEFCRPFKNVPPKIIMKAIEKVLFLLSPHGCLNELSSDTPRVMSCAGSLSRTIRKDKPGDEPAITDIDIKEDCSLFGGKLENAKASRSKRQKHLSAPKNNYKFDTEHMYTFEYYDHLLDHANGKTDIYGIAKIGNKETLDGQAFNATVKTADGRYLWSFQKWHESCLKREE